MGSTGLQVVHGGAGNPVGGLLDCVLRPQCVGCDWDLVFGMIRWESCLGNMILLLLTLLEA